MKKEYDLIYELGRGNWIDAVVGDTLEVFYESLTSAASPLRYNIVTVAEKGPHWRRFRTEGEPGHGSQPYATRNALVPLADADWELDFFGPGFWCAIAVAVLGVLGSLKALLTGKKYR